MNYLNLASIADFFNRIVVQFNKTLIVEDRYLLFLRGLGNTIIISLGALTIGLIIGLVVSLTKYINKKYKKLKFISKIFDLYIYLVRGTPVVLQLMIMYFIILATISNALIVAIVAFGINSGAYVAEIFRGGLESIDDGQMEAGRSLGLPLGKTMSFIIIPQAIKRAMPPMGNEFIALIKETSVAGYVAIMDVTFAANRIQSRTLEAFLPLIISALI